MAIAVATTRQAVADAYKALGAYVGTATADPGTTATPTAESSGGSPAYARKQTTWTSSTGGVVNGSAVTVDVPASTITHMLLASAVSGANMIDKADIPDLAFGVQGQAVITPTYTQT